VLDGFIVVVWAVYLIDLFVAAVPGAWTFRGRRGAMQASAGADLQLTGGFALMRLPLAPWDAAFACGGSEAEPAASASRVDAAFAGGRALAVASTGLAALLLLGLPAIRAGWLTPKIWLIAAVAAWLATIVVFVRAWRQVHGGRVPLETWIGTLASPVGASRSVYALYWRSLAPLHPIAAAAAVCDDAEFLRVARLWRFDHPDDEAPLAFARRRRLADRLTAPPSDEASLPRFCPRCGSGYAAFAEACRDCHVPLVSRTEA
jgi:hypothetical protein